MGLGPPVCTFCNMIMICDESKIPTWFCLCGNYSKHTEVKHILEYKQEKANEILKNTENRPKQKSKTYVNHLQDMQNAYIKLRDKYAELVNEHADIHSETNEYELYLIDATNVVDDILDWRERIKAMHKDKVQKHIDRLKQLKEADKGNNNERNNNE